VASGEQTTASDLPARDQPVSYAQHIKPLFRSSDRESMSFAFDLWEVDDVRSNADVILGRLQQRVDAVRRWLGAGSGRALPPMDRVGEIILTRPLRATILR